MYKSVFESLWTEGANASPAVIYPEGNRDGLHYGFITAETYAADSRLQIPELNSGFIPDESLGKGLPVIFKADVPHEGIYSATVTLYADKSIKNALVFLGRRRLALRKDFDKGETYTGTFMVHICPVVPRGYSERMEDTTLDVTLIGDGLILKGVTVTEIGEGGAQVPDGNGNGAVKTIYIAGDSTVTDQSASYPYHPARSYSGWGQMLSCFVGNDAVVSNHAHSGLTTVSMRSEGHFAIIEERIKKGDICLFQFGHNDQKLSELKAHEGYWEKLAEYVDEMLEIGAVPVIVSPLARNTWKTAEGNAAGSSAGEEIIYNDLLEEYAAVCEELAAGKNIPFIDLHGYAMGLIKRMGREAVKCYFFPSDYTHTNDYGAYLFAGYVYSEMVRLGLIESAGKVEEWAPEAAPDYDAVQHAGGSAGKSEVNVNVDRPDELLTRAEAFTLAITAMKFFPTNVYNDMFTDVVGHETYAGSIQCAYQNGFIPEDMIKDGRLEPGKNITAGEFFEILRLAYICRKTDTDAIAVLKGKCTELNAPISRGRAAAICSEIRI